MKVFVLAPHENWICDRIVKEWYTVMGDMSTTDMSTADVLWLQAGWCWNHIPSNFLIEKKILLTEHHIVPEKFGEKQRKEFSLRDQFIDAYHVPNNFTANFIKQLTKKPIHVLGYWYDPEVWFPEGKVVSRKRLQLPQDKFVIGSFQRDTEGGSGLPKLEKGPDLFCDYLERLDRDDLHVLLGGWRRQYVISRLQKVGIPFSLIEKTPLNIVRMMYNSCDLYVVAARYEGGPQAIYEASATRTPIISSDVGVASDILCKSCVIDVTKEIYYPSTEDVGVNFKNVQKFNIINHVKEYAKILEKVNDG